MIVQSILGFFYIEVQTADVRQRSTVPRCARSSIVATPSSVHLAEHRRLQQRQGRRRARPGRRDPFYFNSDNGRSTSATRSTAISRSAADEGFAYSTVRDFQRRRLRRRRAGAGGRQLQPLLRRRRGAGRRGCAPLLRPGLRRRRPRGHRGGCAGRNHLRDCALTPAPSTSSSATVSAVVFGRHDPRSRRRATRWLRLGLAWGNFDGDGPDELLFSSRNGLSYIDQGSSRFIAAKDVERSACTTAFGASMAVGDFDNDGFDDAAVSAGGGGELLQILFGAPGGLLPGGRPPRIRSSDLGSADRGSAASPPATSTATGVTIWRSAYSTPSGGKVIVLLGPTAGQAWATVSTGTPTTVAVGPGSRQADGFGGARRSPEISMATSRPVCRATISRSPRPSRTPVSPLRARSTSSMADLSGSVTLVARCSPLAAASPSSPRATSGSATRWPSRTST